MENLSHRGKGDFKSKIADFYTQTSVEKYALRVAGSDYFKDQSLDLRLDLNVDQAKQQFTILKNSTRINDFQCSVMGHWQILKDALQMDLSYQSEESEFKNILSLVPGMYTDSFEKLKTQGKMSFEGWTKGTLSANTTPAFHLDLQVKDGLFQYPSLPETVSNVQLSLKADCPDGNIEHTALKLDRLHADLGKNFLDAQADIEKLYGGKINAQASAKLNLEDLNKVFPIQDLKLKGIFDLKAEAKGVYTNTQIPVIQVNTKLVNGFAQSTQYPKPLEKINLQAELKNPTGKYADTKIRISKLQMQLDGEPLEATAILENLDDLRYELEAKGSLDLQKINRIFPIPNTTLAGKITGNIQSSGKLSAIEKQQYEQIPTSGNVQLKDFQYIESQRLPQGIQIKEASATFSPEKIALEKMNGFFGKSDFRAEGELTHYLAFIFHQELLAGNLTIRSNRVDINEWVKPNNSQTSRSALALPQNVDFTLRTEVKELLYPQAKLENLTGTLLLQNGQLRMQGLNFNTLGGNFVMSGLYDPADLLRPHYEVDVQIQNLSIAEAHQAFVDKKNNLKQNIQGFYSSSVKLAGNLGADMVPIYDKNMQGKINIQIPEARMKRFSVAQNVNKFIKLDDTDEMQIKNLDMNAEIRDGYVYYQPFSFLLNEYQINMSGKNSLEALLDLKIQMVIPKNKISPVAEVAIAALTRQKLIGVKEMTLDFALTGTYPDSKVTPLRKDGEEMIKSEKLKQKIDNKMADRREKMKENMSYLNKTPEEVLADAKLKAEQIRADARKEADQIRAQADSTEKADVQEAAQKRNLARNMAERAAENKKKLAYRKAELVIQQAEKKAEKTLQDAQIIADKMREEY